MWGGIREYYATGSSFLGAYDHNFSWNRVENTAASYAAGLTNILMNYTALKKGRFVYLSSESVFWRWKRTVYDRG